MLNEVDKHEAWLTLGSKDKTWKFGIRFDGCIHIDQYYNGATYEDPTDEIDNRDYMHVCHLDEFILMLQEVEDKAKEHFGKQWPKI